MASEPKVVVHIDRRLALEAQRRLSNDTQVDMNFLQSVEFALKRAISSAESDAETAENIGRAVGRALIDARKGLNNFGVFDGLSDSNPERATTGEYAYAVHECERLELFDCLVIMRQIDQWIRIPDIQEQSDARLLDRGQWKDPSILDQQGIEWERCIEGAMAVRAVVRVLGARESRARKRLTALYLNSQKDSARATLEEAP